MFWSSKRNSFFVGSYEKKPCEAKLYILKSSCWNYSCLDKHAFCGTSQLRCISYHKKIFKRCVQSLLTHSVYIFFSQCIKLKGFFMPRSYKTINKSEIVKLSELETGLNSASLKLSNANKNSTFLSPFSGWMKLAHTWLTNKELAIAMFRYNMIL